MTDQLRCSAGNAGALLMRRLEAAQKDCMDHGQAAAAILLQDARAEIARLNALPQTAPDTRKHSETYRLGMDAAFNEVADYMQEQKLYAYAEHIRRRASVAVSRPQSRPESA